MGIRDLTLIMIVLSCASVALRRPFFGLLAFVCIGILNPQGYTWGLGRSFPPAYLTALATMIGYVFSSEPKRLPVRREVVILLSLFGFFSLSTGFAIFPEREVFSQLALEKWTLVSKILIMVFLSMAMVNTAERLHWLLRVIALSLGFWAIKGGVFAIATGGNFMVWGPPSAFLTGNNAIGLAMAMNVPLLFYLAKIETYPWLRKVMWIMLAFSFPAIICTYSRGAWVGLAAATAWILFRSKYKILSLVMAGFLGVIALPVLEMGLVPERVASRFDALIHYEEDSSAVSRFWNWEMCQRVGMANPGHGIGFDFYSTSIYPRYFPEFVERYGENKYWTCHSMWLTVLAEHGLPAFILWVILFGSCFLSLRKLRAYGRTSSEKAWVIPYTNMIEASLVTFAVVGTFMDSAYFDITYQLIAAIVILKVVVQSEAPKLEPHQVRTWGSAPGTFHKPLLSGAK